MRKRRQPSRVMNQKRMIKLLRDNGWVQTAGGRHQVKMEKPGMRPVTLPQNHGRDYSVGLTSAILTQAGIVRTGGRR